MILKLKRTPGIYLVGFMGCGKTTVGRLLADELGWNFADLDEDIESEQGIAIARIFDERGEPEFRRIETAAITKRIRLIERGKPTVLALGGGAFAQDVNMRLLENNGVSVWLDCEVGLLEDRVAQTGDRPLARDPERFRKLYEERRAAYEKADYRVDASREPADVVRSILGLPLF